MPFIVNNDNEVQFRYEIECKCGSTNCDMYIKEADDKESKNAFEEHVIIHVCPHEIRFRCLECGNMADEKSL